MLWALAMLLHVSLADTTYVGHEPSMQSVPLVGKLAQPPSKPLLARRLHVEMLFASAIVSHVSPFLMVTVVPEQVGVAAGAVAL